MASPVLSKSQRLSTRKARIEGPGDLIDLGAAMRNEKVTPNGMPVVTKPRNRGTAEQEQKGVRSPDRRQNIANRFALTGQNGTCSYWE